MSDDGRLQSLDVFRGLTIAAMILVSTPGTWETVYEPLEHAAWNGWTPTDLVFPFFIFAMGAAVPFALARRRQRHRVRSHVVRRGLILFALGLVLNAIEASGPFGWSTFRIPGVLQRIAIVYVVVAWLTERTSTRTQIFVALGALAGYWAVMRWVPVPGFGAGVLTERGNLAAYIDRMIFHRHMAHADWDPEGLLSTVPAIATGLAGVFAGGWLNEADGFTPTATLFAAGVAAVGVGLLWDRVFAINKNLWTSSFAMFTAGLAAVTLAICHWIVDVRRSRRWALPFVALGRNALAAYFLSVGLDSALMRWSAPNDYSLKHALFRIGFASWLSPCCGQAFASLAYAIVYVALWTVVLVALYRRRIFIAI